MRRNETYSLHPMIKDFIGFKFCPKIFDLPLPNTSFSFCNTTFSFPNTFIPLPLSISISHLLNFCASYFVVHVGLDSRLAQVTIQTRMHRMVIKLHFCGYMATSMFYSVDLSYSGLHQLIS
jgi:hypothetical protein